MQCHYEVLEVARDADNATIKKAYRKKAVLLHPDKNLNDDTATDQFRLVQEAWECLSDPVERIWYDEHRDALLKGWSPSDRGGDGVDMLFDVIPFMQPGCYRGYGDDTENNFFQVYSHAFAGIAKEESDAIDGEGEDQHMPFDFGNSQTDWHEVAKFYQIWEGFISRLSFAWADQYDLKEADNRRVRRAMEEENKKARKAARKARNDDILAFVRFVKRRDPRMKALREKQQCEKAEKERQLAEEQKLKKQQQKEARAEWQQLAHENMKQTEEMDRLAGRVRLADLEDDYDYGGGKKKGKKGKNKGKKQDMGNKEHDEMGQDNTEEESGEGAEPNGGSAVDGAILDEEEGLQLGNKEQAPGSDEDENDDDNDDDDDDDDDDEESAFESEEELDVWRCDCCRKEFKSEGQMENHRKSKKHKEAFKKYQKKLEQEMMR